MVAHSPTDQTDKRYIHFALGCGIAAALGLVAFMFTRNRKNRSSLATRGHTEEVRDKTLKDTFPASDPPASQYYGIPVNRI
jgi:hypothetical protein